MPEIFKCIGLIQKCTSEYKIFSGNKIFRQPDDEFDGWLKRIWQNSNWVFSKLAPINGRIRFKINFSTILVSNGK